MMTEPTGFEYDVAISLRHPDRALAERLCDLLAPMSVFFYRRNQEQIAGGDGVETFSRMFRTESRLNVILFREGWGEGGYTGVESTAIRDRGLTDSFKSVFVIVLDG